MNILRSEIARLRRFFSDHPRVVVITGAGISAASGIPTYRDRAGIWQHSQPIKHQEFITEADQRKRYWTRSLIGWPAVRDAHPNAAHFALAELETQGIVDLLITQNVDRLHQRAGSTRVVDLHGRLDQVRCRGCASVFAREHIQQLLLQTNPQLRDHAAAPRPDGDASVAETLVADFSVPDCANCGGTLMPDVVFFGGTVPAPRVATCTTAIEHADAVLAVGSSLQVYSGYRFCRLAAELGKPVAIINPGATRADPLANLKLQSECETLLQACVESHHSARAAGISTSSREQDKEQD